METQTDKEKEYFKIKIEQEVLDNLLDNGKITLDEKYYHERSIKLMKEAEEWGRTQTLAEVKHQQEIGVLIPIQELKEKIEKFFINEDIILKKVDDKIAYLMISRNISHKEERDELLKLRKELLSQLDEEAQAQAKDETSHGDKR